MSKFIDKLNEVIQAAPQPIGFRTAQSSSEKLRILVIASFAQGDIEALAGNVAGADAGLLHITQLGSGAKALQEVSQAVSGIPWGGWLENIGREEIKPMVDAGCDFLVFQPANTSLAILQDDVVGKIIELEASVSEGLLRTVNNLPVDAVLIANKQGEDSLLTWHHLMLFRRFADLLIKPLLVSTPLDVTANELQALWEVGVDGVLVEVGVGQPAGGLKKLHHIIDELTFPSLRKQRRVEALLPHIGGETDMTIEEEEE